MPKMPKPLSAHCAERGFGIFGVFGGKRPGNPLRRFVFTNCSFRKVTDAECDGFRSVLAR